MSREYIMAGVLVLTFGITIGGHPVSAEVQRTRAHITRGRPDIPPVEQQLTMLSARLALTKRQQKEIRPFLQELHRETLALEDDRSLTPAALLAAVRPYRKQTDARIRSVLSDRQKQKLDEIERQPHREIHGDVSGSALAAQH